MVQLKKIRYWIVVDARVPKRGSSLVIRLGGQEKQIVGDCECCRIISLPPAVGPFCWAR